jgi:4-hydroxybenzoyl-CoA reductase beta subunit
MKYGLDRPEVLIGIKGIPARPPVFGARGELTLDPLVSLDTLLSSREVAQAVPLLREAARAVASKEIRIMGTLGGNLCQETRCLYFNQSHRFQFVDPCIKRGGDHCYFVPKGNRCWAVYTADTAPALMALDAEVTLQNGEEERTLPLADLYRQDPLQPLAMGRGEILSRITVPGISAKGAGAYGKFTMRGALEFAAVGVAAVLHLEPDGSTCTGVRIVVGAVGPGPVRGTQTESILMGGTLNSARVSEAAELLAQEIQVVPHHGYSAAYLKAIIQSKAREVLSKALERGRSDAGREM